MFLNKIFLTVFIFTTLDGFAQTVDMWTIKAGTPKTHENFLETIDMQTYTGDTVLKEISHVPTQGFTFITVDLNISREQAGDSFDSARVSLKTPANTYERLPRSRDFLHEYNIKSFPYLKIKKGTHTGTLLFEIPITENKNIELYYKDQKLDISQSEIN